MDLNRVAIIGVGLIGGSFGLALREIGFKGRIRGIGRREGNLIKARERGIIDEYATSASEGVEDADMILLSTPVGSFEGIITDVKERIKKGAIVTDVGSVKAEVVRRLCPLMPEGVRFVGAHPIAGKECSGIECASADIFKGARCVITPTPDSDKEAMETVAGIWRAIGADVITMTPEEHDIIYSVVSHLPHVIAYSLINTILDIREGFLQYGGRGLKDMTRIALSPPEIWRDICLYNRDNILNALKAFSSSISRMVRLMEDSAWERIEEEFKRASKGRGLLESDRDKDRRTTKG